MTRVPSDPTQRPGDDASSRPRGKVRRVVDEVMKPDLVHPALIPGIGVERTSLVFRTNFSVFAIAGLCVAGVILWAVFAPESVSSIGDASLGWVTDTFGWLFGVLAIVCLLFMLVVGYGRTGGVRLGADDEAPEFTTVSWVAMLFSAGMGIGLLFYGPYEPLVYFMDPPNGAAADPETVEAMQSALAQTMLHWGPIPWSFYALVGGAIAYSAYRRGRAPLISAIFEPIFGSRTHGPLGAFIDIFAILVTLFGTAISLGIGALQIARGTEIVTGIGQLGNGFLVGAMAILTVAFIISAVSGIKRGIRALSNINMIIAGSLALFVFVTGPTIFLLNYIPAGALDFVRELGTMLMRNPTQGDEAADFMATWTTFYWAWWVSWTPFVGMFIAKISRGRTLREFVTVVIMIPSVVCLIWFGVLGGTSMWMKLNDEGMDPSGPPEAMLFDMLGNLPLGAVTSTAALISILVFFVTSADSASIVMGSITQRGKPDPSRRVTITWGVMLGGTAISLLLAGGEDALGGLQSIMVVSALPFAFIVIGIMFAWYKDLATDPYIMRRKYARLAIAEGVRLGIADYGDDFVFGSSEVAADQGAGAWLNSTDPMLSKWYVDAAGELRAVTAEDIRRSMDPGRIQPKGPDRPDFLSSGESAMITEPMRLRLGLRRQREEEEEENEHTED